MIIDQFVNIIFHLITYYFWFSVIYIFLFAFASFFYRKRNYNKDVEKNKFLVLIPAYKEDLIIQNTAKEALKQNYPNDLYDVYVIADSFMPKTLESLKKNNINFIEVSFAQSTKARSINKALNTIKDRYDGIVILDADNIMEPDFLLKVNAAFVAGNKAIQGHRVAKNQDTNFARLDAASEEINNTIFRKGHRGIGLSSALIGSAMAFDYDLYREIMDDIDTFADEDKELEIKLFIYREKIEYLNGAYVYDEKVSNSEVFVKQRSRWISSQIYYARTFLFRSIRDLITKSNIDLFNKIVQFLLVPRIMLLGFSLIITIITFFFGSNFFFYSWLGTFLLCVITLLIAVPGRFYNKQTFIALMSLPWGFIMMILATLSMKLGSKRLSPTPHRTASNETDKNK